jgi:23S rRNA (guanosine2251-2'-O)-methyltransferase
MSTKPKNKNSTKRRKKIPAVSPDLIWGIHPVLELLRADHQQVLELRVLNKSAKLKEIIDLAQEKGLPFLVKSDFPELSEQINHQDVMARIKPPATIDLPQLLSLSSQTAQPLILVLDSIQDPHNFGAIIRSAAAAGVSGIIYPKDRSAPLSGTVAKVSVGAINRISLCPVTNLAATLQKLKKVGFWIFGAAGGTPQDIYQADFKGQVCLVIGGERKGIRPLVRQQCDFLVSIPMQSGMESLNASVAASIIMFEVIRQQKN